METDETILQIAPMLTGEEAGRFSVSHLQGPWFCPELGLLSAWISVLDGLPIQNGMCMVPCDELASHPALCSYHTPSAP